MAKAPAPKRGEIWLVAFDPAAGAEVRKVRPAFVIRLNIQSFFTDHDLIRAINDLSIAVKLELASVEDQGREGRAKGFVTP